MRTASVSALLLLLVLGTVEGYAASARKNTGRVVPGGIAFPAIYQSPSTNVTGLVSSSTSVVTGGYSPTTADGKSDYAEAGAYTAHRQLGLGVQYQGSRRTEGDRRHGLAAGAALRFEQIAVGAGVRDEDLSNTTDVAVDLAVNLRPAKNKDGNGTNFGGVIYSVNQQPKLGAYVGYLNDKTHFVEANLVCPLTSASSRYEASVATGVYVGPLGVSLRTRYYTDTKEFVHTLGGSVWVAKGFNVSLNYDVPNHFTIRALLTF